jgi:hypothetical protein
MGPCLGSRSFAVPTWLGGQPAYRLGLQSSDNVLVPETGWETPCAVAGRVWDSIGRHADLRHSELQDVVSALRGAAGARSRSAHVGAIAGAQHDKPGPASLERLLEESRFTRNSSANATTSLLRLWRADQPDGDAYFSVDFDAVASRLEQCAFSSGVDARDLAEVFSDVQSGALFEAWNRRRSPMLAALVLLRLTGTERPKAMASVPVEGRDLHARALSAVLQLGLSEQALATAIESGYASTENAKRFLISFFEAHPERLFVRILGQATLEADEALEFMRLGFDGWAQVRSFGAWELAALKAVLKPSVLRRIRDLLLPTPRDRSAARNTE